MNKKATDGRDVALHDVVGCFQITVKCGNCAKVKNDLRPPAFGLDPFVHCLRCKVTCEVVDGQQVCAKWSPNRKTFKNLLWRSLNPSNEKVEDPK